MGENDRSGDHVYEILDRLLPGKQKVKRSRLQTDINLWFTRLNAVEVISSDPQTVVVISMTTTGIGPEIITTTFTSVGVANRRRWPKRAADEFSLAVALNVATGAAFKRLLKYVFALRVKHTPRGLRTTEMKRYRKPMATKVFTWGGNFNILSPLPEEREKVSQVSP